MRLLIACLLLVVSPALASEELPAAGGRDIMPQPPSVVGGSVGAFYNPAAWLLQDDSELAFYWTDQNLRPRSMDTWGLSLGRRLGFSVQSKTHDSEGAPRTYAYQVGTTFGNREGGLGIGWRWGGGDKEFQSPSGLSLGFVSRPGKHVSWGVSGFFKHVTDPQWGSADVGVRPFRKPWLTAFGDYTVGQADKLTDGQFGGGFELRPVPGIHLGYRAWKDPSLDRVHSSINLGVTLNNIGFHAQPQYREYNAESEHQYTSYLVRVKPPHSGLPAAEAFRSWGGANTVAALDLEKQVISYDRNTFFTTGRKSWLELSRQLDAVERDASIAALAINLSGSTMRPSLAWELRSRILGLRALGKQVYVHSDNYSMGKYYVASAADSVSMDPMGILRLPGLAFHRTYWQGFLQKLGIGSQEWRLFTHKTAFQTYVRKDMSGADKEQIGRLADVIYETWRAGICGERNISTEAFDHLVDEGVFFTADQTVGEGLVDHVGTWGEFHKRQIGSGYSWKTLPDAFGRQRIHTDDHWGAIPEIAVVYTVGPCAMDSGIQGRRTSKYVATLANKKNVKALVLRVDSPGGDPLPCELINRAVHTVKDKHKPVIVSQGDVAASGGYYLSMPADTILATPLTVTGSIGVIFGWLWDDGFSEKSGFTADGVQRGKSADLLTGIKIPFLPVKVPERNLTPEELEKAKAFIGHEYDLFVASVARERGLDEAHVRKVAEGHVWMAEDALRHRLIDGFGGFQDAIDLARTRAGLREDDVYLVTEYPRASYFELPRLGLGLGSLTRGLFPDQTRSASPETDYETEYMKLMFGQPGSPMFLMLPTMLPEEWSWVD